MVFEEGFGGDAEQAKDQAASGEQGHGFPFVIVRTIGSEGLVFARSVFGPLQGDPTPKGDCRRTGLFFDKGAAVDGLQDHPLALDLTGRFLSADGAISFGIKLTALFLALADGLGNAPGQTIIFVATERGDGEFFFVRAQGHGFQARLFGEDLGDLANEAICGIPLHVLQPKLPRRWNNPGSLRGFK